MRVSPFRNPRLNGYVRLPAAYRSLSRLSSALSAKASALRPFRLTTLCLPLSRPAILAYMAAVQILILLFWFPRGNLSMSSYLLQRFSYVTGYNLLPHGFKFYPMKDCFNTYAVFKVQFSCLPSEIYLIYFLQQMGLSGLEPPTSRLSGVRSNLLSYKPIWR